MKSIIRLFKAVPIKYKKEKKSSEYIFKESMYRGFVFTPEVIFNYSEKDLMDLIKIVENEVGLNPKQMNSSFHKSWSKVRDSSLFQLVIEQIIHYWTTYGFERLGIYNKDSVYIPNEDLNIPELEEGITLTVIKGYTKEELKEKLLSLLSRGIALKEDTVKDVIDVSLFLDLNEEEIESIKNKETKIALYDYLGKFPENPIEFLRFIIYKSIKQTLLIKDKETIKKIKENQNVDVLRLFRSYRDKYGLENLAQIFFRFKPLFLAFRTNSGLKPIINRIRKLANVHHKPMKQDFLNNVTAMIKRGERIEEKVLKQELAKVNTFRKIRLVYALHFRVGDVDSILYRIRNGKAYAKEFSFENKSEAGRIYYIVMNSIIDDLKKNVEGKKIYIPSNVVYSLPATEKQFTGDFPAGTYITIPKDMVIGVHWENTTQRIDLDLSIINMTGSKIGWDAKYRTENSGILFSGDLTDAPLPNGASELFFIKKQVDESYLMFVNFYNYEVNIKVPIKILVALKKCSSILEASHMVDPNDIICVAKSSINTKQKILGLIVISTDECRFYFAETSIGRRISASVNKYTINALKYLRDFYLNSISLNEILELAGAEIVSSKEEVDIDLSPEILEKDKIIGLIK